MTLPSFSTQRTHGDFDFPIFLNADHAHSLAKAIEAAKAGFDAVAFDGSAHPLDENIAMTRKAVEELKAINPDILVEGEIGDIGSGSGWPSGRMMWFLTASFLTVSTR